MASKPRTIKLSPDLDEAADIRAKELGYGNRNAYIKGLVRYDNFVQGEHTLTLPYAALPLEEQDKIDAKCLDLARRGVGERGQFLKRIVEGTSNQL